MQNMTHAVCDSQISSITKKKIQYKLTVYVYCTVYLLILIVPTDKILRGSSHNKHVCNNHHSTVIVANFFVT